ncbi:retrovirus-related pol polyprotein from transposon TNT 1-94 [Tanacetum coccineum]
MPSKYQQDYKKTRAYAPKIYNDPNISNALRNIYRTLESRYVHEGGTIDPSFYNDLSDDSVAKFTAIGICIYSDAWGLDELEKTLEQIKPYNSRLPAIDDVRNLIYRRTVHEKVDEEGNTIHKLPNQIETNELFNHLRPYELVIRKNVYSAIGNRDHTQEVIALMLYCPETKQPFNLAYFIIRRMYFFRDRNDKVLPYGMILTRLFSNLKANMAEHPFDKRYKLVPRKISSLKAKQPKKPPPKRTRNVGKSKRTQLSTSSSTEPPPLDNKDLLALRFPLVDEDMINKLAEEYMDHIDHGKRKNEITGEIPQTRTSSGVRSTEEMDSAINDLTSKFASMSTVLEEIRSAIVGGGNHSNHEVNKHGNHRSRANFEGFYVNHGRNYSPKEIQRHDDIMSSDEEEREETLDEYNRGPRRGDRPRTMVGQNVNPRGYGERKSYWVKAEIPNFVGNLDIEVVLYWLYDVNKFFDIIEVPEEEQVKVVVYNLRGGAGAWLQAHCNLRETDEQSAARYIGGINSLIQERLSLTPIWSVDQAQNMPMKVERMASKIRVGFRLLNMESLNTYGIRSNQIQSTILKSGNKGLIIDEAFQEEDELEYAEPFNREVEQVTYVVQRTLCSPKVSDSSQRNKIFQTKCLVKEKSCFIIIDGGSCENLVSKALVKAFKLPTESHPSPYQIGWIKKGPTLKVTEICKVPLAIGKHYQELVTCNVVDMEACRVLLGRPWQHDVDATRQDKMSQDVITVGSTMPIPLFYRGEYSQWSEWFMNYLEEKTEGEAMINYIKNSEHPLPVVAQVSLAGTTPNAPHTLKDSKFWTTEEKRTQKIDHLWDALERKMCGSKYGEQDRKAAILYEYETFKAIEGEQLLDTYLRYLQNGKQYGTLMRKTKNLMDINIDALYNILKQNQGDVNDVMGYKKKAVVVTSDLLALVVKKTKVSKRRGKVVVQSESEGSDDEDISDLKKITALLAKAFNRKLYYAKPTNNNLRTYSASSLANKKPEYVKSKEKKEDKKADEKKRDMSKVKCYNCKKEERFAKDCKKAKVKDYNYYKTKMLLAKKDSDEQVLLAEDQAWMESSSDLDQEISANMNIYDNSTNYGLFVNNDDDQEIFHDAIESASENFNENHIVSQTDHDQLEVDHNDSEGKDHLVDK